MVQSAPTSPWSIAELSQTCVLFRLRVLSQHQTLILCTLGCRCEVLRRENSDKARFVSGFVSEETRGCRSSSQSYPWCITNWPQPFGDIKASTL